MSRTLMLWMLWITVSAAGGLFVLATIVYGGNRVVPADRHEPPTVITRSSSPATPVTPACSAARRSCRTPASIAMARTLKAENDSHPLSKFTDPRNADRIDGLDARYCVTCHQEHRPGITRAMGVTLPDDYCFHCHHDIAKDRPSHAGLKFTTCTPPAVTTSTTTVRSTATSWSSTLDEPDQLADAEHCADRIPQDARRKLRSRCRGRSPRRCRRAADTCRRRQDRCRLGRPTPMPAPASIARAATPPRPSRTAGSRRRASRPANPATHNQATDLHRRPPRHAAARGLLASHDGPFGLFKAAKLRR